MWFRVQCESAYCLINTNGSSRLKPSELRLEETPQVRALLKHLEEADAPFFMVRKTRTEKPETSLLSPYIDEEGNINCLAEPDSTGLRHTYMIRADNGVCSGHMGDIPDDVIRPVLELLEEHGLKQLAIHRVRQWPPRPDMGYPLQRVHASLEECFYEDEEPLNTAVFREESLNNDRFT